MGDYFGLKFLIFQACLGIFLANIVLAQAPKRIEAKYIEKEINIDGNLNEEVWDSATEEGNFMQFFPTDSLPAKYQTTFKAQIQIHQSKVDLLDQLVVRFTPLQTQPKAPIFW